MKIPFSPSGLQGSPPVYNSQPSLNREFDPLKTGYSLYILRQVSRRSWRIGQRDEVAVKYFAYANTAQEGGCG